MSLCVCVCVCVCVFESVCVFTALIDTMAEDAKEGGVAAALTQRHVEHRLFASSTALVRVSARAREVEGRVVMERACEHRFGVTESLFHAVAVVHVNVDVYNALKPCEQL